MASYSIQNIIMFLGIAISDTIRLVVTSFHIAIYFKVEVINMEVYNTIYTCEILKQR